MASNTLSNCIVLFCQCSASVLAVFCQCSARVKESIDSLTHKTLHEEMNVSLKGTNFTNHDSVTTASSDKYVRCVEVETDAVHP